MNIDKCVRECDEADITDEIVFIVYIFKVKETAVILIILIFTVTISCFYFLIYALIIL